MRSFRTQQKLVKLGNIIDYAFTLIKVGKHFKIDSSTLFRVAKSWYPGYPEYYRKFPKITILKNI